jgi:hypothetical protein
VLANATVVVNRHMLTDVVFARIHDPLGVLLILELDLRVSLVSVGLVGARPAAAEVCSWRIRSRGRGFIGLGLTGAGS